MDEIERWVTQPLPEPYRTFLTGQPDDPPVNDRVLLYGQESFIERNETYEVKEYCPGYVTIGDDSGGQQFLLSLRSGEIYRVDAGAMTPDAAALIRGDFTQWQAAGYPWEE